jgi:hypothetical protein
VATRDLDLPPTLENLSPPNEGYPYFVGRDDHPFVAAADDFRLVNAGWLIDASLLAYAGGERVGEPRQAEDALAVRRAGRPRPIYWNTIISWRVTTGTHREDRRPSVGR